MYNRSIGIYDSGLGGLSVWREIRDRLPHESLLYLGDGANCPYGLRSTDEIHELALKAVEILLDRGCKMIVVACNTATAVAIESLRLRYPHIPFVGMEPAVKPACLQTQTGVVGVLATQRSIEGDMYHRTAAKYGDNIRVISRFGRGFVELVESNMEGSEYAQRVVADVVSEFVSEGVDQIVLGCTHYPFLRNEIARVAPRANIIDPSPAIAKRVERLLVDGGVEAPKGNVAEYDFITFADDEYLHRLMAKAESILKM